MGCRPCEERARRQAAAAKIEKQSGGFKPRRNVSVIKSIVPVNKNDGSKT